MRKFLIFGFSIYSVFLLSGCNRQALVAVLRGVGDGMQESSRKMSCDADPNCINVNVQR
ncbi:MAG: hypothetical protein KCHDKBKB_02427 [Elusimicrobia bacterium]|nr:hypothetical protein [Elusimicrobiota bacterium]